MTAKRRPSHLKALELPYTEYIALNGGREECGICGRPPKPGGRKLHRDHNHRTGRPRALLCHLCNRRLDSTVTIEWLLLAIAYLKRTEAACDGR